MNFIIISPRHWEHSMGTTAKSVAIEFSKLNRVLFIGPPLQRKLQLFHRHLPEVQKYRKIIQGKSPELIQINKNLQVFFPKTVLESINWISNKLIFNYLHRINERRLSKQLRYVIKKLNFSDYIIFNDTSMLIGFYFKEYLNPKLHIYLIRDAVVMADYHSRHGKEFEPRLIRKSDLIVTNSDFFADYARKINPNSHMVGQGCDVSIYCDPDSQLPVPADLDRIEHPRIGYVGFLTTIRLDIDLLIYIAMKRPDLNIVLVGPEDEKFRKCKLHEIKNIYFLGIKDQSQLPGYIKGFDVAINPQIVNTITDVNYPLKIDEYLAMGKPVVATKTTFMNYFRDYVYLADTKEEYVGLIEKALLENSPEKEKARIDLAKCHSWKKYSEKVYTQIELLLACGREKKNAVPSPFSDSRRFSPSSSFKNPLTNNRNIGKSHSSIKE